MSRLIPTAEEKARALHLPGTERTFDEMVPPSPYIEEQHGDQGAEISGPEGRQDEAGGQEGDGEGQGQAKDEAREVAPCRRCHGSGVKEMVWGGEYAGDWRLVTCDDCNGRGTKPLVYGPGEGAGT